MKRSEMTEKMVVTYTDCDADNGFDAMEAVLSVMEEAGMLPPKIEHLTPTVAGPEYKWEEEK